MAACTSAVMQSPATPLTAITPIAIAVPVPALTATIGQSAATAPAVRAATMPAGAARTDGLAPASAIFELQQRMQAYELSELRTTYNGAYGANLLFTQNDLMYYVTLLQQKDLWRVIRTASEASAERLYSDFAKQTRMMADLELQRIHLKVQKERSERQVAMQQEKLRGLKISLDIQRQQQTQTQERQKVARAEVEALDVEHHTARTRVNGLQRQIYRLETQVNAPFNSQPCRR